MDQDPSLDDHIEGPIAKILSDAPPDIIVNLPRKGDILYFQGDIPSYLYLVAYGSLVTVMESPSGDPVVWEMLGPFDTVGSFAMLMRFPYPATCRANIPSKVHGFSRDRIWSKLEKDLLFRETLLNELGDRFQILLSRLLFSQKSVEARISMSLLALLIKTGPSNTYQTEPPLNVTRSVLASLSLTTVESTIRITKKWESQGILEFPSAGRIRILDPRALKKISGDG